MKHYSSKSINRIKGKTCPLSACLSYNMQNCSSIQQEGREADRQMNINC